MRKRIIATARQDQETSDQIPAEDWIDLESLAEVELTSEDPAHPIESALLPHDGEGWRAAEPGEQTIRLVLNQPRRIRRIWLKFVEPVVERTQQFTLRWSIAGEEDSLREIVRQQWNFNPHDATSETEDFQVDLPQVSVIELTITPDVSGGDARASLSRLRLA